MNKIYAIPVLQNKINICIFKVYYFQTMNNYILY